MHKKHKTLPQEEIAQVAEAALIAQVKNGDKSAFESLYRKYVGRVYGLCLRMTGRAARAEDCVQETFVKAWAKIGQFRGSSAFGTWLHRIAVNEVLGRQRKDGREGTHRPLEEDEVVGGLRVVGGAAAHQPQNDLVDLERAIESLPDGARNVFVLNQVYGYSHQETGGLLNIAIGTSKAQLHRARALLAEKLK